MSYNNNSCYSSVIIRYYIIYFNAFICLFLKFKSNHHGYAISARNICKYASLNKGIAKRSSRFCSYAFSLSLLMAQIISCAYTSAHSATATLKQASSSVSVATCTIVAPCCVSSRLRIDPVAATEKDGCNISALTASTVLFMVRL